MHKALLTIGAFVLALGVTSSTARAATSDPKAMELLQKAADNFEKVKSIRASIQQSLMTRASGQRFAGEYVASTPGRFNITYTYPYDQKVVSDGKQLWWYIPKSKKLWYMEDVAALQEIGGQNNLQSFQSVGFDNIEVGPKPDVIYTLRDSLVQRFLNRWKIDFVGNEAMPDLKGTFWLNRDTGFPAKLEIYDTDGEVTLRQTFENYHTSGGASVPTKVLIEFPKTRTAIQVEYANIQINLDINNDDFHYTLPEGVPVVPLTSAM